MCKGSRKQYTSMNLKSLCHVRKTMVSEVRLKQAAASYRKTRCSSPCCCCESAQASSPSTLWSTCPYLERGVCAPEPPPRSGGLQSRALRLQMCSKAGLVERTLRPQSESLPSGTCLREKLRSPSCLSPLQHLKNPSNLMTMPKRETHPPRKYIFHNKTIRAQRENDMIIWVQRIQYYSEETVYSNEDSIKTVIIVRINITFCISRRTLSMLNWKLPEFP